METSPAAAALPVAVRPDVSDGTRLRGPRPPLTPRGGWGGAASRPGRPGGVPHPPPRRLPPPSPLPLPRGAVRAALVSGPGARLPGRHPGRAAADRERDDPSRLVVGGAAVVRRDGR